MKCVCPMGGDRTCPDDCPLAVWASLSPTDRKAQRKAIAEKLYKLGFTMEAIATQLGVSARTISEDLSGFEGASKPARPKGGRPKGKKKTPAIEAKHDRIITLADAGLTKHQIASETGVGHRMVDRVLEIENARREPTVTPDMLSMTAQEKFNAAMRQHKRNLDAEFERRVVTECKRRLDEISLPHYAKQLEELERSIRNRKGIMDRLTYRKILACLHPDRVADPVLKKRYEEAFRLFTELEKRVLNEKESPTEFRNMPRTYEELMAMKAKVQAERRAKRKQAVNVR